MTQPKTEHTSHKTRADVFFKNNERQPERGREAWTNADGTLYQVFLDGKYRDADDLKAIGVTAVDFWVKTTFYL